MYDFKISVAIAVYNGEKYLREQLDSIIGQLRDEDEIVVSYNVSTDSTIDILREYEQHDKRVKITECAEKGVIANFENAILNTSGDYVFLADQDDVWLNNKVETILNVFDEPNVIAILHNCTYVDTCLNNLGKEGFDRFISLNLFINIIKNHYQGSCMAFRRSLVKYILPFPRKIAMHDQWIGIIASRHGKIGIIQEPLMLYRRHDNVITSGTNRIPPILKIKYIAVLIWELLRKCVLC